MLVVSPVHGFTKGTSEHVKCAIVQEQLNLTSDVTQYFLKTEELKIVSKREIATLWEKKE